MKTKTTLASLLLAAVMVTPSYGADKYFFVGAEEVFKHNYDRLLERVYFTNWCYRLDRSGQISFPSVAEYDELYTAVARYVYYHPEHRYRLSNTELVKRACKEAWPNENKHVLVSR